MGLLIMEKEGLFEIPGGGGINHGLLTRVSVLEGAASRLTGQLSSIAQSRGDSKNYGMVMLADSDTVTESTGLALPASEKNAGKPGTLANKIETRTSIETGITFSNINTDCVLSNISYGFIKNGVGHLQIDAIIRNSPAKEQIILFKLSNCTLRHYAASDGISSEGKFYTVGILADGNVYIHPAGNVGDFNIRHQIAFRAA